MTRSPPCFDSQFLQTPLNIIYIIIICRFPVVCIIHKALLCFLLAGALFTLNSASLKKASRGSGGRMPLLICDIMQQPLAVPTMTPLNYSPVAREKHQRLGPVRGRAPTKRLRYRRLRRCQAAFAAPLLFMLTADGLQGNMSAGHSLLCREKTQLSASGRERDAAQ